MPPQLTSHINMEQPAKCRQEGRQHSLPEPAERKLPADGEQALRRILTPVEHSAREQLLAIITADIQIQAHGSAMGTLVFMKRVSHLLSHPSSRPVPR